MKCDWHPILCWILPIFHVLEANAVRFSSRKLTRFETAQVISLYMHHCTALFYRDIFSANFLYAAGRSCIGLTSGSSMTVSSKRNWVDTEFSTHDLTHVFRLDESVSAQDFAFWSRDRHLKRVLIQPRPRYARRRLTTPTSVSTDSSKSSNKALSFQSPQFDTPEKIKDLSS